MGMAGGRRGVVSGPRATSYWMTAPRSPPREPESLLPLHGGYRHLKSMSYPRRSILARPVTLDVR